jgi:hypothetical protein
MYAEKNSYNPMGQFRKNTINSVCLPYLSYKTLMKMQEIDIILCAHCLIKNLFMRKHMKTHKGKRV